MQKVRIGDRWPLTLVSTLLLANLQSVYFRTPQTLQSLYKRLGEIPADYQIQQRRERLLRQPAIGLIERTFVQPFKTEGNVKVSFVIWIPITVGTQGRWDWELYISVFIYVCRLSKTQSTLPATGSSSLFPVGLLTKIKPLLALLICIKEAKIDQVIME